MFENIIVFTGCLESALYPDAYLSPSLKDQGTANKRFYWLPSFLEEMIFNNFRKLGTNIPFRRKSSDLENKTQEPGVNGKDSIFKIIHNQVFYILQTCLSPVFLWKCLLANKSNKLLQ